MTSEDAQKTVAALARGSSGAVFAAGLDLLRNDYPEILLPLAQSAAVRFPNDPQIQQLAGLVARALGHSGQAFAAFTRAARLAPNDALIAHSRARAALEAGYPSSALFDAALKLNPADGSAILGRAAAHLQESGADRAIGVLTPIVDANPLWTDGHQALARLRGQNGLSPDHSLVRALHAHPRQAELHQMRISTALQARDLDSAATAIVDAERRLGTQPWLSLMQAHVASETGNLSAADRLFGQLPDASDPIDASLRARHAIRAGRPEWVIDLPQALLAQDHTRILWPYRSLAWRMTGDPRHEWLEGDERLIGVYDLADRIDDFPALADLLRKLHTATDAPLDQSVRGGTQTDGNLLIREDAPLRALRTVIMDTVALHIAQMPPPVAGHPTLPARRAPHRIAGSWSVRLLDAGFHVDHVHSQGWLSSAFYVSTPEQGSNTDPHAGWLSLGECRELVPGLDPLRLVEPRPGRLVLFPSTLWHGTRPFPAGERMSVAFDIAMPKQS